MSLVYGPLNPGGQGREVSAGRVARPKDARNPDRTPAPCFGALPGSCRHLPWRCAPVRSPFPDVPRARASHRALPSWPRALTTLSLPTFPAQQLVLDKESFTLEELLEEDDVIQECKSLNSRLIDL